MSFVKTLATLAVGFAAAKGYDKYKTSGGMEGVKDALQNNPQLAGMQDQAFETMEKMGLPTEQLRGMAEQFLGKAGGATEGAASGLGGLMAALGGGMAAGASQTGQMIDAMTGTTAATDLMEENAKLMIRTMIMAARADGEIDAEEREKILSSVGDIDEAERAFIQAEMDRPVDPMALAADTTDQMKAQVYATAVMAVRVDTLSEARFLTDLANALGLSEEARERVHAAMGVS